MNPGDVLSARRAERGLTIAQASRATRIQADQLRALEDGRTDVFAAPVYALGHMRTYAAYLGLDPEALVGELTPDRVGLRLGVGLSRATAKPRVVLTGSAAAASGLLILAGAFGMYAWRQMSADERPPAVAAGPSQPSFSAAVSAPSSSPAVQGKTAVVGVRVTENAWINVVVDGRPQYGTSGRTLAAGSTVYFTGADVQVSSANAAATFVTVNGRSAGAMGAGVATRVYTSQTSTQ